MAKTFHLEILTPERVLFSGEVLSLKAPGVLGQFQLLAQHAPLVAQIDIGVLEVVFPNGLRRYFATSGGFVEVKANRAVVLAEAAEAAEEIDIPRAQAALQRAQQRLREPNWDRARAEAALKRAQNRLQVAARYGEAG
jgi:F-type H+-transporting ATPase subunit epsilon|nr:MAG: ATP synthase epsilon chain [Bacteroidota bacterium]